VEAVLSSPSVDDCSTMPVGDSSTLPVGDSSTLTVDPSYHDQILSALERIRDERNDATYGATVDEVLDKILDNTIEARGSSARDVYSAIISPARAEKRIDNAIEVMNHNTLREAVQRLRRVEADANEKSHCIFSMLVTSAAPRGFEDLNGFNTRFSTTSGSYKILTPQLGLG
jgi:hypothetical protein